MAQNFAINAFSDTMMKSIKGSVEQAISSGAEYERQYWTTGDNWVDIYSTFTDDISKDGNAFVRAQRWDNGGYRSYRCDRGLVIRKKGSDQTSNTASDAQKIQPTSGQTVQKQTKEQGVSVGSVITSFVEGAAFTAIIEVALTSLEFVPGPVGITAVAVQTFLGQPLVQSALMGIHLGMAGISIAGGENPVNAVAGFLGNIAGGFAGVELGGEIGPTFGLTKASALTSDLVTPQSAKAVQYTITEARTGPMGPFNQRIELYSGKSFGMESENINAVQAQGLTAKVNRQAAGSASNIVKVTTRNGQAGLVPSASKQAPGLQSSLLKIRSQLGMF